MRVSQFDKKLLNKLHFKRDIAVDRVNGVLTPIVNTIFKSVTAKCVFVTCPGIIHQIKCARGATNFERAAGQLLKCNKEQNTNWAESQRKRMYNSFTLDRNRLLSRHPLCLSHLFTEFRNAFQDN